MKLTTIVYGRKKNDGDYGTYHLEVAIELEEGDNGTEALAQARTFVHAGLAKIAKGLPLTQEERDEQKVSE